MQIRIVHSPEHAAFAHLVADYLSGASGPLELSVQDEVPGFVEDYVDKAKQTAEESLFGEAGNARFVTVLDESASLTRRAEILRALTPFGGRNVHVRDLKSVEALLYVQGEDGLLQSTTCVVESDDADVGLRLRSMLETAGGFHEVSFHRCLPDATQIVVKAVEPERVEVARWVMRQAGVDPDFVVDDYGIGSGIRVRVRSAMADEVPAEERFPVGVICADPVWTGRILEGLRQAGFAHAGPLEPPAERDPKEPRFRLETGPFTRATAPRAQQALVDLVTRAMDEAGVDASRYPVEVSTSVPGRSAVIEFPIRELGEGTLGCYAGPYPERFPVRVLCDDDAGFAAIEAAAREAGFVSITHHPLPEHVVGAGFRLFWSASVAPLDVVQSALRSAVHEGVKASVSAEIPDDVFPPAEMIHDGIADMPVELPGAGASDIVVFAPIGSLEAGTLEAAMAKPIGGTLRAFVPDPESPPAWFEEMRDWGWEKVELREHDGGDVPQLVYGGVSAQVRKRIVDHVFGRTKMTLAERKEWSNRDLDVWIRCPDPAKPEPKSEAPKEDTEPGQAVEESPDVWTRHPDRPTSAAERPFLRVTADSVHVGEFELPRRQPGHELAPQPAAFTHYCVDEITAQTLAHIAQSVTLREPCLLEGVTSTSKTSSILYLAALLNQPVVRLNLNGQTDTGELVGRFVPEHRIGDLPLDPEEMRGASELLEIETRMILRRAGEEGRPLTAVEVQQVMANERIRAHPWQWVDGMVVRAMKEGWWVLLDEVNLAEPQILERLNSVLERDPQIVLSEYDNSVIGGTRQPVHPDFRMFATMNPAEYAGRAVLSPAYRDRWRAYRFVERPREKHYREMLSLLVTGRQPQITIDDVLYEGFEGEALFAGAAGLEAALAAIAAFHAALERAIDGDEGRSRLGPRRKERYVFTRRGLLSLVEYLSAELGGEMGSGERLRRAIERYYLQRLSNAEDREAIVQLLDASGISRIIFES